jgi:putative peptidoglycan lipid II flippase
MSFIRSILTVSSLTVISRVTGFMRDALAAAFIGASPVADAFFVALRLPSLFRSLFAEGAFSAAFVPLYAKALREGGPEGARHFTGEALSVLLTVLTPFTCLFIVFMPQAMLVLAPGFNARPHVYDLAVTYARITFPYLMLVSVVALLSGVLNSNRRFAPGAAAPIAFNLIMILALLLAALIGAEPGIMMAGAVTLSGLVQWAWMHLHCLKLGVQPDWMRPRLSKGVKELFARVGPGALGAGATQINIAISTVLASLLPSGSVSWLFYADRLNQPPLGIIGIAVATTLLPVLSTRVQAGDHNGVRHYTTRAVEFSFVLGLPAMIGLAVAARPIIHVLFEQGAFTSHDTRMTAFALSAYSLGLLPFILIKVLSAIFFSHHDTKTPVRTAVTSVVLNIVFALSLLHALGHAGIALATALASWANFTLLLLAARKQKKLLLHPSCTPRLLKIVGSVAVMALFLLLTHDTVENILNTHRKLVDIAVLSGYIGISVVLYSAALLLSKATSLKELKGWLKKES